MNDTEEVKMLPIDKDLLSFVHRILDQNQQLIEQNNRILETNHAMLGIFEIPRFLHQSSKYEVDALNFFRNK